MNLFTIPQPPPPLPEKGYFKNWFSNMLPYEEPLGIPTSDGKVISFWAQENFYQAMKTADEEWWDKIAKMSPFDSKKAGKIVPLRPGWGDGMKVQIMEFGLHHKFAPGTEWYAKLMATGDEEIVEWQNWRGDYVWGRTIWDNQGYNLMGKLLMKLRLEYRGFDVSNINLVAA